MNVHQPYRPSLGLFGWALLLLLTACEVGGGAAGTSTFGTSAGAGNGSATTAKAPVASDLVLVLGANSVSNSGNETLVATATAIDGNRNTLAGVPVVISVDNNAVVTPKSAVTDTGGRLESTIGIGADRTPRSITVTARAGTLSKTAVLTVQDAGSALGGIAPSDLLLTLSASTIANNGTQTITANATALDAKRNVLPGVVVAISVNQGATASPTGAVTNASGVLSAVIGTGGNSSNRVITVTATAGLLSTSKQLQVVDMPSSASPEAADLSLSLSASSLSNNGSSTVTATAVAVDARRNALAGIPVTFTVDNSAVAVVSGSFSNASGAVVANVGVGADRSNRVVTVTASSGTLTRSASFVVTGAALTATYAPLIDAGSLNNAIEFRLVDANSSPMSAQKVTVFAPGLAPATGTTDLNGKYVYRYNAAHIAGTLSFTATAAGDSRVVDVQIRAGTGSVPAAQELPRSASLTPTPSVVTVNPLGSTANQVELRALFLGANNQPLSNVRARFDLAGNSSSSDGTITWLGGNYAYSDATGVARATFTPGQRSSPTNGVTVGVCFDTVDFPIANCATMANRTTSTLTVTSEALSVSIRTNELIKSGAANLTYIKEYVVMVVDAAGQAKADIQITPSVDLTSYYKGLYSWNGEAWTRSAQLAADQFWAWNPTAHAGMGGWNLVSPTPSGEPSCPNEDRNRNGILETTQAVSTQADLRQEDLNGNGEIDPRKADVAIKMVGSSRTDANGLAIVQIEYGRSLSSWLDYIITVTASGISGTESRARYAGRLPADTAALTRQDTPPAFAVSPYGRGFAGSVAPVMPTGRCDNNS
jgi:hypothetical protein